MGRKLEHDPEKWKPVFRKACPRLDPGDRAQTTIYKRDCPFPQIPRALDASVPLGKAARAARTRHYQGFIAISSGVPPANKKTRAIGPGFFELAR
jgi:hypothetical protein